MMELTLFRFVFFITLLTRFLFSCTRKGFSITKGGGIRIGICDFLSPLYPSDITPKYWSSCDDATTYTWENDFEGYLNSVSINDKLKLSKSIGFCPHRRCQLQNVSQSEIDGGCPANLCYTKIENGRLSFGTCCFHNYSFNAGHLIGYFYKSQPSPKPIYKRNRIILSRFPQQSFHRYLEPPPPLGHSHHDNDKNDGNIFTSNNKRDISYDHFINANMILPNLIATQCPLTSYPAGFANTILDAKQMIAEQDISLWIQLSPYSEKGELPELPLKKSTHSKPSSAYVNNKHCEVFPLQYFQSFHNKSSIYNIGITNFTIHNAPCIEISTNNLDRDNYGDNIRNEYESNISSSYYNMSYILNYFKWTCRDTACDEQMGGDVHSCPSAIVFSPPQANYSSCSGDWSYHSRTVYHIWYYHWTDFEVPSVQHSEALMNVVDYTVDHLRENKRVTVSCFSGRGRSGTFAALVFGKLYSVASVSHLVDIIVAMRENRDGLLETPKQLHFVLLLLGLLPDSNLSVVQKDSEAYSMQEKKAVKDEVDEWDTESLLGYVINSNLCVFAIIYALYFFVSNIFAIFLEQPI